MGSCGSSAKVKKPLKISHRIPTSPQEQGEEIEEIKTPDKYCRPSGEFYTNHDDPRREDKGWAKTKDFSRVSSRNQSVFNLQKDLIETLKHEERRRRLEHPSYQSGDLREKNDATPYQITKEQHFSIYMFVEEINRTIYEDIFKLYTHLIRNMQEHEDLALIVESLRSNNKDVENCVDDLQVYPFENENFVNKTIETNSQLIRHITSEFNDYKRNIKDYKWFKENVLSYIKQYNLSQQDTRTSEETPELLKHKKKPNLDNKSRYIHHDEEGADINKTPDQGSISPNSLAKKKELDINSTMADELRKIQDSESKLKELLRVIEAGTLENTKRNKEKEQMKKQFLEDAKNAQLKCEELGSKIADIIFQLERSTEEHFVSSSEYLDKLKKLNNQVKQQKEIFVSLEKHNQEKTRDISNQAKIMQNNNSEIGSATLKKFDSNRMFIDGRPTSKAKLEMRRGDNTETELEFLNENEESPNLTSKLRDLKSIEPYHTRSEHTSTKSNY